MKSLLEERRLSPSHICRELEISAATVGRWFGKGVRGVRLESIVVGGRRYTTREALQRFVDATTAAPSPAAGPADCRTNRQRDAAIARAEAELEKAGV